MTTKVSFKSMYKAIGFSDDADTELTDTEVVDSMPKLSRITSARAPKICKAPPPRERMALQILGARADVIRDNLGMESTTSVSVSLVAALSETPMALYIALKASLVVMVLIRLTLFIGHWDRGEVFSFVTLTDNLDC